MDVTRNTRFVQIVKAFIQELGLQIFWSNPDNTDGHMIEPVSFTHAQCQENIMHVSTIDHFISTNNVFNSVAEAGVYHSATNISNHSPIFCKINVGEIDDSVEEEVRKKKPCWNAASQTEKNEWSVKLATSLKDIIVPDCVQCCDVLCTHHEDQIIEYCTEVLDTVEKVTSDCLPTSGGGH